MATSREERTQQRMRGAGRHEVADDSFGFVLPVVEAAPDISPPSPPPPPPPPAVRSEPNTSAKRRRLNPEDGPPSSQTRSSASRASRASRASGTSAQLGELKGYPYDVLQNKSPEDVPEPSAATSLVDGEPRDDIDILESEPAVVRRPISRGSVASRLSPEPMAEEVTESPAEAPGSGHRRRIRVNNTATQSAKLQRAVMNDEAGFTVEFTTSSPLARKTRSSVGTSSALPARSTRVSGRTWLDSAVDEVDELSPEARPPRKSDSTVTNGSARSTRSQNRRSTLSTVADLGDELSSPPDATGSVKKPGPKGKPTPTTRPPKTKAGANEVEIEGAEEVNQDEADDEEAEEIDVHEPARPHGRKRPQQQSTVREESPELHSEIVEKPRPVKEIRQKKVHGSSAKQSQPKEPKKKNKSVVRRRSAGEAIPITVQRYTKHTHVSEDDTGADILNADIPFCNRGGVNIIDVLMQVCDEVIDNSLETLHEAAGKAENSGTKKELKTKFRALEAFQEELRTRLLEHTIALDTMHALKKRVRSVQKEKLALRDEILRIRAEREQVALKMDAVRIRHETANRESLLQLGLSSTMDDIELAIENGKSAPDLSPRQAKQAELANLELLISKVAGQASSYAGDGGGSLKQIRDFNAFLERAAVVLETR
ncbi:hypothetical protein F4779DRAFT_590466 [Xylariaceae sp. FL0662B]|nr:hypothetical protein F4779DRAFT_590466 [Xylariaceae sp. FL0662B]